MASTVKKAVSKAKFKAGPGNRIHNTNEARKLAKQLAQDLEKDTKAYLLRVGRVFSSFAQAKGSLKKADSTPRSKHSGWGERARTASKTYANVLLGSSVPYDDAMDALVFDSPLWDRPFKLYGEELSEKMLDVIEEVYKTPNRVTLRTVKVKVGPMFPGIVDEMSKITGEASYRLYRIARTEVSAVSNVALERGYRTMDPEGKLRYTWDIVDDARTSDVCHAIQERVEKEGKGRGVSLARLEEIVTREAMKHRGSKKYVLRRWVPHINCRSAPELVR